MKWATFAFAFLLTNSLVIAGTVLYPDILGKAATTNNDFVFALFLGPFFMVLFFSCSGEKTVLRLTKKEQR
jgi:hypothetical protein